MTTSKFKDENVNDFCFVVDVAVCFVFRGCNLVGFFHLKKIEYEAKYMA